MMVSRRGFLFWGLGGFALVETVEVIIVADQYATIVDFEYATFCNLGRGFAEAQSIG